LQSVGSVILPGPTGGQGVKFGPLLFAQKNICRVWDACHAPLNHDSSISDSGY
jgi:hypothetical protein